LSDNNLPLKVVLADQLLIGIHDSLASQAAKEEPFNHITAALKAPAPDLETQVQVRRARLLVLYLVLRCYDRLRLAAVNLAFDFLFCLPVFLHQAFNHVRDKVPCLHFELGQIEAGLTVGVLAGTYFELPIEDLVQTLGALSRQIALLLVTTVLELLGSRLATTAVFTRPAGRLMITSLPKNTIRGVATIISAIAMTSISGVATIITAIATIVSVAVPVAKTPLMLGHAELFSIIARVAALLGSAGLFTMIAHVAAFGLLLPHLL
jgi:hypothetical protein